MNIAFPLPLGNLTSVLRLRTHTQDGVTYLSLASFLRPNVRGDQGVYFVTRYLGIRLPINEIIEVFPEPYPDFPVSRNYPERATVFARHRMWLFGIRFLTLHYAIWSE